MARITKLLVVVLSMTALALPGATSAHVLKTDHDMGIVMHIDPEDEAVAGVPSPIYLTLSDKTGRFTVAKCGCEVFIAPYAQKDSVEKGTRINLSDASSTDNSTKVVEYTFPKPDVYAIQVVGIAKDGSFSAFSILFDVRVASYGSDASASPITAFLEGHVPHFVIFGGGFLFFIGAVLYDRRKRHLQAPLS